MKKQQTQVSQADRRVFLTAGGMAMLGAGALPVLGGRSFAESAESAMKVSSLADSGAANAPSANGEGDLSVHTIADAEQLAGIGFNDEKRTQMLQTISQQIARFERRQQHPFLPNDLAPAQTFNPILPGMDFSHLRQHVQRSDVDPGPLPERDEDIAYAPVTQLARWIARGELTSARLTNIYLVRLKRLGPKLECVITLTEDLAQEQAARADAEIARGRYRGPLHGIPWGAKDLLDTAGISTTWGATPYVDRTADHDAAVVEKLHEAGAVLVAKLTLGALAYNDIWFGGRTNNPWNLEQGSSGSSAGSAAATVAGLVGFSIGTETYGSIVSPCMRCGATGLRPTFGRVSRHGAMALCWSLDKIGPICRTVEDCLLVLDAINGGDARDASSIDMPLSFDATKSVRGVRLGFNQAWFDDSVGHQLDRSVLDVCRRLGMEMIEIDLPDMPYDSLLNILFCEAAAAFEELTRTGQDETLKWQEPRAWPNTFRQSWFIPGIELVQAERMRRRVMEMMASRFAQVDAIISPSFAANLLLITNNTGHPSLTIRTGLLNETTPHGITIIGNLFDEGTLCTIGMALERELNVWQERPNV